MVGSLEMVVLAIAEIGESDVGQFVLDVGKRQPKFRVAALEALSSRFHLPFSPQRKPTEPFGTTISPVASS